MAYAALDEAYQTITNPKEYIKINNKENKASGKNKKTKKSKQKKIENFDNVNLDLSNSIEQTIANQNNYDYNVVEPFANPDDVIHEYSPISEEDSDVELESQKKNKSNKKSNYIRDSDSDSDSDSDTDNNSHDNMVNDSKNKQISDNDSHNHEIKNEIREINKKINFILNKINQDSKISQIDDTNNIDKNMHDIILFIIFGAFIILVLDSLCRLIIKNNLRA